MCVSFHKSSTFSPSGEIIARKWLLRLAGERMAACMSELFPILRHEISLLVCCCASVLQPHLIGQATKRRLCTTKPGWERTQFRLYSALWVPRVRDLRFNFCRMLFSGSRRSSQSLTADSSTYNHLSEVTTPLGKKKGTFDRRLSLNHCNIPKVM